MDETYMKVKGQWRYLYRAGDKHGQTIDFLLTEQRDEEAALRFLKKAIGRHGVPEKTTINGSAANEAAIKRYNEAHGTAIVIRQVKYLNNMVEQDHRAVKRVTRPMLGFKSFDAAQSTLIGIELMHMMDIAPCGRAYRGEYRCPSRQPTLGRKCLNLKQKKCKFLYDQGRTGSPHCDVIPFQSRITHPKASTHKNSRQNSW
jgi:hypothetical protein